ncbi:hypothetical protein D3C71_2058470 [compost metagenome]
MHTELLAVELRTLGQIRYQVRCARRRGQGRHPVVVGNQVVHMGAGLEYLRPLDQQRHTMPAFIGGALLAGER